MTFFIRHASISTKKLDLIRTPYLSSSAALSITLQYISTASSVSGYTFCSVSRSPTIFFLYSFFRVLLRRCTFLRPSRFHTIIVIFHSKRTYVHFHALILYSFSHWYPFFCCSEHLMVSTSMLSYNYCNFSFLSRCPFPSSEPNCMLHWSAFLVCCSEYLAVRCNIWMVILIVTEAFWIICKI
jgi:hypothetical protein